MNRAEGEIRLSLQEICYYLFFALLLFAKGIGLYDGQGAYRIFFLLAMLFWAVKVCTTKYTGKELALSALLLILGGLAYLHTREKGILLCVFVVVGMKDVPVRRVMKLSLLVWGATFVSMSLLTATGVLDSPFRVQSRPFVGTVIRWALGHAHPNVAHISYLLLSALIVYALREKIKVKTLLLLFAGNCLVFLYTSSFTGFLMTTLLLLLMGYFLVRRKPSPAEKFLLQCAFPLCVLLSLGLPLILRGAAFDAVDRFMNHRLGLSRLFLTEERITLFGSGMQLTNAQQTMDNSYVFAFMTYGVVLFVLMAAGYVLLIRKLVKEERWAETSIVLSFLAAGLSEPFLFNTSFKNITLVFLGGMIYSSGLEARLGLGGVFARSVELPDIFRPAGLRLAAAWERSRRQVVAAGLVCGLAAAVLGGAFYRSPSRVIVPRKQCESEDNTNLFLDGEELKEAQREGALVLGYVDGETPMFSFGGTLIWVELARRLLSYGLAGMLAGAAGGMAVSLARGGDRKRKAGGSR